MPFHHRLLGKDKYAIFSFIQSMNTVFGMSIWEPVAIILAQKEGGYICERQYKLLGEIDEKTEKLIREIHHNLREGKILANKEEEIEKIRKSIKKGKLKLDPDSVVDLFLKIGDEENYFEITTAKPNMKEFSTLKLKLMRWIGLRLSQNKNAKIFTRIAIPYNPYHPQPYKRWTLKNLYDLENGEILVGEEFWNFVAGKILKEEIDKKFSEFNQ